MGGATTRRTWRFLRTTFMTATFAAIDVGTNSTNLLVIDGNGTELTRIITSTRLGEDLQSTGELSLDAMTRTFDAAMAEKQRLQDETDLTKKRMDAATALISGLSGEKTRWTQQSNDFSDQIARLVGDCGLACAFMSYCGAFNKTFRDLGITIL